MCPVGKDYYEDKGVGDVRGEQGEMRMVLEGSKSVLLPQEETSAAHSLSLCIDHCQLVCFCLASYGEDSFDPHSYSCQRYSIDTCSTVTYAFHTVLCEMNQFTCIFFFCEPMYVL